MVYRCQPNSCFVYLKNNFGSTCNDKDLEVGKKEGNKMMQCSLFTFLKKVARRKRPIIVM